MELFREVRLQTSAVCRAWVEGRGCFSASEWERARTGLGATREFFEGARLRVSEALAVEGIDPLGVVRRLLIHESAAPLARAWVRETGFVHVEAASGIHLYALWRAAEFVLARFAARFRWPLGTLHGLRTAVPLGIGFFIFAMSGFRAGLIRPLLLVGMRWASARFGFRWSRAAPIGVALAIDAALGFFRSFGSARTFAEWAPGEMHYALAWWGGVWGYEWARAHGWSGIRAHAVLSGASWVAVLPLDLAQGRFAPATPLLSLFTVEFLVRGGYLALALGMIVPSVLQWLSLGVNRMIGAGAAGVSGGGGWREVPEALGFPLALGLGILVGALSLTARKAETPREGNRA